jgi:hypothetical protein
MDVDSLIAQWRQYALANKAHAVNERRAGDDFGAELAIVRGAVRQAAAELLQQMADDPLAAAKEMHNRAKVLWQHALPLIGFDEAALKYTRARTWQDCALALDPSLPIVQPKLND